LDITAVNSKTQTVVAGSKENIENFQNVCSSKGIKDTVLHSEHAFHSHLMDPIVSDYKQEIEVMNLHNAKPNMACKFVSGVTGKFEDYLDTQYWIDHARKPVQFLQASQTVLQEAGCNLFLGIGPQPVLACLLAENADALEISGVQFIFSLKRNQNEYETMLNGLGNLYKAGVTVNWESFHQFYPGRKIALPNYPFQQKKFPIPTNKLKTNKFHPFIHSVLTNPTDFKILQSEISLNDIPFLKDLQQLLK